MGQVSNSKRCFLCLEEINEANNIISLWTDPVKYPAAELRGI